MSVLGVCLFLFSLDFGFFFVEGYVFGMGRVRDEGRVRWVGVRCWRVFGI